MKNFIYLIIPLFFLYSCEDKKKNVLIIGDSISLGYTPYVKEILKDDANVIHNYRNAKYTRYGLDSINNWLGDTKWDIIHFNFGLHDLCYRSDIAIRDKINGKLTTTIEEYESNLRDIAEILQRTKAKIIFATTTMVPDKEPGRFSEDVKKYNQVACEVMVDYGIEINDLYNLSLNIHPVYGKGNDDVHYNNIGYQKLADHVAKVIKNNF